MANCDPDHQRHQWGALTLVEVPNHPYNGIRTQLRRLRQNQSRTRDEEVEFEELSRFESGIRSADSAWVEIMDSVYPRLISLAKAAFKWPRGRGYNEISTVRRLIFALIFHEAGIPNDAPYKLLYAFGNRLLNEGEFQLAQIAHEDELQTRGAVQRAKDRLDGLNERQRPWASILQDQLSQEQATTSDLRTEILQLKRLNEGLQNELRTRGNTDLFGDTQDLESQRNDALAKTKALLSERDELVVENGNIKAALGKAEKDLAMALATAEEDRLARLETQAALVTKNEGLETTLNTAHEQNAKLAKELNRVKSEMDVALSRLAETAKARDFIVAEADSLKLHLAAELTEVKRLQTALASRTSDTSSRDEQITALKLALTSANEHGLAVTDALTTAAAARDEVARRLEAELVEQKERAEKLEAERDEALVKVLIVEGVCRQIQGDLEEERRVVGTLQEQLVGPANVPNPAAISPSSTAAVHLPAPLASAVQVTMAASSSTKRKATEEPPIPPPTEKLARITGADVSATSDLSWMRSPSLTCPPCNHPGTLTWPEYYTAKGLGMWEQIQEEFLHQEIRRRPQACTACITARFPCFEATDKKTNSKSWCLRCQESHRSGSVQRSSGSAQPPKHRCAPPAPGSKKSRYTWSDSELDELARYHNYKVAKEKSFDA